MCTGPDRGSCLAYPIIITYILLTTITDGFAAVLKSVVSELFDAHSLRYGNEYGKTVGTESKCSNNVCCLLKKCECFKYSTVFVIVFVNLHASSV